MSFIYSLYFLLILVFYYLQIILLCLLVCWRYKFLKLLKVNIWINFSFKQVNSITFKRRNDLIYRNISVLIINLSIDAWWFLRPISLIITLIGIADLSIVVVCGRIFQFYVLFSVIIIFTLLNQFGRVNWVERIYLVSWHVYKLSISRINFTFLTAIQGAFLFQVLRYPH